MDQICVTEYGRYCMMEEQHERKQVDPGNIDMAAVCGVPLVGDNWCGIWVLLVLGGAYIMTDLQKIANRLRAVASEMIDLGFDMNYFGGFSDLAVRGVELTEGGMVVQSWAEVIGEEVWYERQAGNIAL